MKKEKVSNNSIKVVRGIKLLPRTIAIATFSFVMVFGLFLSPAKAISCSTKAECQQDISNLNSQASSAQQSLTGLASQDQSYESTISSLEEQINSLQSEIASNQAQQASINQQIASNEALLVTKKASLADDIKTMYVNGQMTTMEELATSKNLSDYIDKQKYRSVVEDQLDSNITAINTLESTLSSQKQKVSNLISTEQSQNDQLSYNQSQEQSLLNYNQSQQAAYNAQIASAQSNIGQLQAELTALNTVSHSTEISGGTCGGGYPTSTPSSTEPGTTWGCYEPQDNTTDNWGMDNRECVSYTAFMVYEKYGISTSDWGNAYQWITAAESAGYTVDQTPSVGSVLIRGRDYSDPGDVGHAMFVVAVNSPTDITVDEYNEHYNGTFDQREFDPTSYADRGGIYYIHFN